MSTYRERREARAARLREWAAKREARAQAAATAARERADLIPLGQPVLVGHHSERRHRRDLERIDRGYQQAAENADKARDMARRADNIEAQAERAIYDDDPDAVARLRERIAELEAARDRWRQYNASCRKAAREGGTGDQSILDSDQQASLASVARHAPYQLRPGGAAPVYVSSNLSGNISRLRRRLDALETG